MKIAIVGPGAMGMLFASYLTKDQSNEIYIIGRNEERMSLIAKEGILVTTKDNLTTTYYPKSTTNSNEVGAVDLVVMLVKATQSEEALESHKALIGPNTILMTLQNGSGHESLLQKYAKFNKIALGTTQDGAKIVAPNHIIHTGIGDTTYSMLSGDNECLEVYCKTFNDCGFNTFISDNIKYLIWHKLLLNASTSALSALLNTTQGYCVDNPYAWTLIQDLVKEACAVALADGIVFDVEEQIQRVLKHNQAARDGLVSICADLRNNRMTEVDTISGSVLRRGIELGVPTPTHQFVITVIHAMETRSGYEFAI